MSRLKNGLLLLLLGVGVACGGSSGDKPTYEYMPNMMDQASVKAYEETPRLPVVHTMPQGFKPYPYKPEEGELAAKNLQNPMKITRATLEIGQESFNTYCIVCHGEKGKGQGSIVPKFPMPPTLHSEKVVNYPDGRIFHIVKAGQNLMPSYASQIPDDRIWAIIYYVRALERSQNPTDEDLKAYEAIKK